MKMEIPNDITDKIEIHHWMKSKGFNSDAPYDIMESYEHMCWFIRQDDKFYNKWIGDEYLE